MSSFPASSLTTMQSQFTSYLASAEKGMLSGFSSLANKFAGFNGMNLTTVLPDTGDTDIGDSLEDMYEK